MIRINWSRTAVSQLALVRELDLRTQVYLAIQGLRQFPQKGRLTPETVLVPELKFPEQLREIIFPRLFRVFYIHDPKRSEIRVMGIAFHGQEVDRDWLLKLLSD